jgi:RimJ/RimL family protein N-acetyltransferase
MTSKSVAIESLEGTDHVCISAGRVTLRRFTRTDADKRGEWPRYEEPVFEHLNMKLDTREEREAWYRREAMIRYPFWFAVVDDRDDLVGIITLREVNRWKRSARLGIHLHPARVGRGYGTEAMRLFMHYYFDLLRWRVLRLDVAAYNHRGIRCYEKVGFRFLHEFWRPNFSPVPWLRDDRFIDVRPYVMESRGGERVKHWEMAVTVSEYRELSERSPNQESCHGSS